MKRGRSRAIEDEPLTLNPKKYHVELRITKPSEKLEQSLRKTKPNE